MGTFTKAVDMKTFILTLLILHCNTQTTLPPITGPDHTECPSGWVKADEGCFLFHYASAATWFNAQLECEQMGGYLAEPKHENQAGLLTSLAYMEQSLFGVQSWWIGLSDWGHEGRWIWQHSVDDANFTMWAPGSPSSSQEYNKDCAVMDASQDFFWADVDCGHSVGCPLCQRGIRLPVTTTTTTTRTTTTTTPDYPVVLVGGNGQSFGNVFAYNELGVFGPVCDDNWGTDDANVVCRQLGYTR